MEFDYINLLNLQSVKTKAKFPTGRPSVHTKEQFWLRDFCERSCAAPISEVESHISDKCSEQISRRHEKLYGI